MGQFIPDIFKLLISPDALILPVHIAFAAYMADVKILHQPAQAFSDGLIYPHSSLASAYDQ